MADKLLFPVFEVPEINTSAKSSALKYKKSLYFDYSTGDFVTDGANKLVLADGKEAYRQWCIKTVMTERYDHLAYGADYGAELEEAMKETTLQATESAIERTITEALKVNPHTEYVKDFAFDQSGDGLNISFTVKGKDIDESQISLTIST